MPPGKWTIRSTKGGSSGSDLVGCHIVETADGYEFTSPDGTHLASSTQPSLPFSFGPFDFAEINGWTVTVDSLTRPVGGSWSNPQSGIQGEEGTWSAGATEDADTDEGAASAGAY